MKHTAYPIPCNTQNKRCRRIQNVRRNKLKLKFSQHLIAPCLLCCFNANFMNMKRVPMTNNIMQYGIKNVTGSNINNDNDNKNSEEGPKDK